MSEKNLKQRDQIPQEYKWNIEDMYPDESLWEKDVDECIKRAENFKDFSGKLTESPQTLLSALRERDSIWQKLEHAFVYAAMKKDEDNRVDKYQAMDDKCGSAMAKVAAAAALSSGNIPMDVYRNLIKEVHNYLPVVHRYIELRKKVLGVDHLRMYDVYVPLVAAPKKKISFEEAVEIMAEGLAPLGSEYIRQVRRGIESGWVDVYENQGKTSGAYSFGAYDSMPYILLNYTDTLKDVFTIVHEMGHSMHSYYTRNAQPYTYGDHSIFTAEVASTVNESLLIKHLLATEKDENMRKYLLNYYIEEFRTTLFRQTMFAEFELLAHEEIEKGGVLTAGWLNDTYNKLNDLYFGPAMEDDGYIKYEWSRIPHFYRGFYVYQYATGYSAATAISAKILEEGETARENYIKFLKSGSSDYPVELLKIAGVDMASPQPVKMAMETFKNLVDELEKML